MIEQSKLKDMMASLKTDMPKSNEYITFDAKQVTSELEDITYFIEQAKKYRNKKSVMRAAVACQALGTFLESLAGDEE